MSRRADNFLIVALGTTQTLAWASSYYLPAILADPIARDLGISMNWLFAAFSMALVISGLLGPRVGRQIDRMGGREVLCASNLILASGLFLLGLSQGAVLMAASWLLLGVDMGLGNDVGVGDEAHRQAPARDGQQQREVQVVGRRGDVAHAVDQHGARPQPGQARGHGEAGVGAEKLHQHDGRPHRFLEVAHMAQQHQQQRRVEQPAQAPGPLVRLEQAPEPEHLALLLPIAGSALAMRFVAHTDIVALKAFVLGLMRFDWQPLPADPLLLLHLSLVMLLMVVFPISKLLHAPGLSSVDALLLGHALRHREALRILHCAA